MNVVTNDREQTDEHNLPERNWGWRDMFVHEDDDPRADGNWENTERGVLLGFLSDRRLTLEMKCMGLNADQLASRAVPPSDLSLLGLVRHLTEVERYWFRHVLAGEELTRLYQGEDGDDLAFEVKSEPAMVDRAWAAWRTEVAYGNRLVSGEADLGSLGAGKPVPYREVLVHMIREYAQHMGQADLLRERIDGRIGQ
jgi:uncharacterized damage-inducible protein DinB